MALVLVPFPSALPVAVTDYEKQNDLHELAFLGENGKPLQIVGMNVVRGSVFQIGGAVYQADADTAIAGTPSNYVKITPAGATASAAFVANLAGVTWSSLYNGYYDVGGNLYVFDEVAALQDGQLTAANLKHILKDSAGAALIGDIAFPKWATKEFVGTGFDLGNPLDGNYYPLAAMNVTDVAEIDDQNKLLKCYRYDFVAKTWGLVGAGLNIAGIGFPALTSMNATDVAFIDGTLKSLRCYRFNGAVWALVGAGLAIAGAGIGVFITALTTTDIAYIDTGNKKLRTYHFDGANWSMVGAEFALDVSWIAMTTLSATDIALCGAANDLSRYHWDGATWSLVGSTLPIAGLGNCALTALNGNDVLLCDSTTTLLRIYRFVSSGWKHVGIDIIITGVANPFMAAMSGIDFAFADSNTDLLRRCVAYFAPGAPYHP